MAPVPAPRVCHIVKRDTFDGYGFNLYKKKNTPGQFVGFIDQGSPAEDAGLKEGDEIVEVNEVNVEHGSHKQVVQRIREIPNHVTILVIDKDCEEFHKEKKVKITNLLPYLLHLSSQQERDIDKINETHDCSLETLSIMHEDTEDEDVIDIDNTEMYLEKTALERTKYNRSVSSSEKSDRSFSTDSVESTSSSTDNTGDAGHAGDAGDAGHAGDALNLPLTAKQMRERIDQMKRKDPRKDGNGDWWKKHMIIQAL